ncbi:hypothetical protein BKA93DRAFT_750716 [Sparassis latifolia]
MSALDRDLRSVGSFTPYYSGTSAVPNEDLVPFYRKDRIASGYSRYSDLRYRTEGRLGRVIQEGGKLDTSAFSMNFHPGDAVLLETVKTDLMEAQMQKPIRVDCTD